MDCDRLSGLGHAGTLELQDSEECRKIRRVRAFVDMCKLLGEALQLFAGSQDRNRPPL